MSPRAGHPIVEGAAGRIEVGYASPGAPRMVAVIAHPHPLFGGTMDNKVVTTLARAFAEAGARLGPTGRKADGAAPIPRSWPWIATSAVVFVIFLVVQARGLGPLAASGLPH